MVSVHSLRLLAVRGANALGKPFGLNFFPRVFPNPLQSTSRDAADVFDKIYQNNFWASDESRSGLGSAQAFATDYLERLTALLLGRGLTRLFDAPCGDLNWILKFARDPAFRYDGGVTSASLTSDLSARFPDLRLRTFDISRDRFPNGDAWHCRDCLFHLPFRDVRAALANFAASSIPFALLTTHKARLHTNLDVEAKGFRYLDLERRPIGLPPALVMIKDFRRGLDFPRYVGLWTREDIARALDSSSH